MRLPFVWVGAIPDDPTMPLIAISRAAETSSLSLFVLIILSIPKFSTLFPGFSEALAQLHSTSVDHLLTQVVLVITDSAIPRLDALVLAHQNLFGNLVQKSEIV